MGDNMGDRPTPWPPVRDPRTRPDLRCSVSWRRDSNPQPPRKLVRGFSVKPLRVTGSACNVSLMNTTATTAPVVTIDGTAYIYTGTMEGVGPEFRTTTGAGFVGMPTHQNAGEFHMVPTARRGKIRGQFTWSA